MYLTEWKGLDATQLKLIAMILMVLDHIYEFFSYTALVSIWFTWLGRLVFPIFMFTMTEGFYYTKSKEKYLLRLYIGTALMGILNYLLVKILPRPDEMQILNNIFSTFFMTVFYLYLIEKIRNNIKTGKNVILPIFIIIASTLASSLPYIIEIISFNINVYIPNEVSFILLSVLPSPSSVEGGPILIILGIIMYYNRDNRRKQILTYIFLCLLLFTSGGFNPKNLLYNNYQWMMVFSAIFMLLYNGNKGKGYKYLFYVFYPSHIYILYILSTLAMLRLKF